MPSDNTLCSWIAALCDPEDSVGVLDLPSVEGLLQPLGFHLVSPENCDILLGTSNGRKTDTVARLLQLPARKLFLRCPLRSANMSFRNVILNENNLLEASILLPGGTQSLLVLDKSRNQDGRMEITFVDASHLDSADKTHLQDIYSHGIRKDFRDVIIHKEPLIACQQGSPRDNIMQRVLDGPYRALADCAEIVRCPPALQERAGQDCIELSCLSPRDFALFGYTTLPSVAEFKSYPREKIRAEMYLQARDILLVTQRNIGKTCILSPAFSKAGWIGAAFLWIIRPETLDPRLLWMYLSSELVHAYLTNSARGGAIPTLPVRTLQQLPVPIFDKEESTAMIRAFDELVSASEAVSKAQMLLHTFYTL